ncbi:MAG: hypothetical protein Fur0041_01990 [Bacteroidia bacterium]
MQEFQPGFHTAFEQNSRFHDFHSGTFLSYSVSAASINHHKPDFGFFRKKHYYFRTAVDLFVSECVGFAMCTPSLIPYGPAAMTGMWHLNSLSLINLPKESFRHRSTPVFGFILMNTIDAGNLIFFRNPGPFLLAYNFMAFQFSLGMVALYDYAADRFFRKEKHHEPAY